MRCLPDCPRCLENMHNRCADCGDQIPDEQRVGYHGELEWQPQDYCDECSADRIQAEKEIRQLQRNLP